MTHRRIRPFNTRDTYPEQALDNDLCQAVVAGDTVYLRGQVAQDLDTRENVAVGDAAGQAHKVMDNVGSKDKTLKVFTREEGGYHHCQIDNASIGVAYMWDWVEDKLLK